MAFRIEDGKGRGYIAAVNNANQLITLSTTVSREHKANHTNGQGYQLVFQQTPTGAGDVFLYVKNTSEDDIVVEGLSIRTATDESVEIVLNDSGTASGGSDATPTNCNAGSGNAAIGTFQTGNDITGLSGGSIVDRIHVDGATSTFHYNFEMDLILPKNATLTIYAVTGAIQIDGTLVFFYDTGLAKTS